MSGFLVISSSEIGDNIEDLSQPNFNEKICYDLRQKEDMICINNKKISVIVNKMGRRHSIINFEGVNYVMTKIEKPMK